MSDGDCKALGWCGLLLAIIVFLLLYIGWDLAVKVNRINNDLDVIRKELKRQGRI